jgi:leucyl-tRNA synthetase
MMIFVNEVSPLESLNKDLANNLLLILAPFAPHITEELWHNKFELIYPERRQEIFNEKSIHRQAWPKFNAELIKEEEITIVIQVNGKLRDNIVVASDASENEIKKLAASSTKIKPYIEGKKIIKTIYVPKKLINIVVPG